MPVAYLVAAAFALAALLAWILSRAGGRLVGGRLGGHERGQAPRPPRLGGIAVLAATAAVGLLAGPEMPSTWRPLWPWVLVLYGVGVLDDVVDLPARLKLLVQVLVCFALTAHVQLSPVAVPDGTGLDLGPLAVPATVLWLLLVVNAFNIVDGADGLAGGLATLCGGALALLAMRHQQPDLAVWLAIYAAAHGGFLLLNWRPARIYLGDAGSLGAGLALALAGLTASNPIGATVGLHTNVLLFWLPLTEMVLTVGRRLLRGQPLFRGDDRHIHHTLAARGWRQDVGVALLLALASLTATAAVVSHGWRSLPVALLVAGLTLATFVGVVALGYVEVRVLGHRLGVMARHFRRRGGALVAVAEAAARVRAIRSWPELSRALEALVAAGVLDEARLDRRGPAPDGAPEHSWTLEQQVGESDRPGYTLHVRSRADGLGHLRPDDVRAYLVPALTEALARLEGGEETAAKEHA